MPQTRPDRLARIQRVFVPYGIGAVLMGAVNVALLELLQGQYPNVSAAYIEACVSPLFAAVQEPLTSKLLPAILVLGWTGRADQATWLRERWLPVAAAGGLTVGTIELLSKALDMGALQVELLPPVGLHVVTATLVGWSLYRTAGRDRDLVDAHLVLLTVGLAILLHLGWNRYAWPAIVGGLPC